MTKIKLTPSLLDHFQNCPHCFAEEWRAHQQGRSRWHSGPKAYPLALGTAAHDVLACIGKRLIQDEDFPSTDEAMSRYFNPSHFTSKEQALQAQYELVPMLDAFREWLTETGATVVASELTITGHVRVADNLILVLAGRVDTILTDMQGTFTSLDFKTGTILTPDALSTRLSSGAYRCLTGKQHPEAKRIQIAQLSLSTGIAATAELTDTMRKNFRGTVFQLAQTLMEDPMASGPAFAPAEACPYCHQADELDELSM